MIAAVLLVGAFVCLGAALALVAGCTSWQAPHDPKTERLTLYGRIYNAPFALPLKVLDGVQQFSGESWDRTRPRLRMDNPDVPGAVAHFSPIVGQTNPPTTTQQ